MAPQKLDVTKTDEEWRKELSPEAYHVLRERGTERAVRGPSPPSLFFAAVKTTLGMDRAALERKYRAIKPSCLLVTLTI